MPLYKTRGIVLRVLKYNEADKIVHLLSEDGIISAIAKGSRKTKSRYGGVIEVFCEVDFVLHEGKSLHTVTQASSVNSFKNIRRDFNKYLIASAVVELIDKISMSEQKDLPIFSLLEDFLKFMDEATQVSLLILPYMDWQIMHNLGIFPHIDIEEGLPEAWLNFSEGKIQKFDDPSKNTLRLEPLTIRLLKSIINLNFEKVNTIKLSDEFIKNFINLTESFIKYQLQVNLKTRGYIEVSAFKQD